VGNPEVVQVGDEVARVGKAEAGVELQAVRRFREVPAGAQLVDGRAEERLEQRVVRHEAYLVRKDNTVPRGDDARGKVAKGVPNGRGTRVRRCRSGLVSGRGTVFANTSSVAGVRVGQEIPGWSKRSTCAGCRSAARCSR